MKIISKIQLFICLALGLMGCEDFLNKDILGQSDDKNYYETVYQLQSALNACYDILQTDVFNECEWRFGEACADDVIGANESLSNDMGQLVHFRFNTSNEWISNRWMINYKGIHRTNLVIANAHRVQLEDDEYTSYKTVREILGQAKFLRAFYYFNLVKTYGGVPIRPEVECVDSLVQPRNTLEEVYAYIEKDLREAAVMLPARYTGANAGKASAGAAMGMLMKVLMYQAEPSIKSKKWEEMVSIGEYFVEGKVMTYGDVLGMDSPSAEEWELFRTSMLFKPKSLNKPTDPYETVDQPMVELQNAYSLDYKDSYGKPIDYIYQFYQGGEFCTSSVFEVVFKESADGTTGDTNEGGSVYDLLYSTTPQLYTNDGFIQAIFGKDPRGTTGMPKCIITDREYTPDGQVCFCGPNRYVSLKWYTPIAESSQYSRDNPKNRRIMRYPEVVLMYAEALNESGLSQRSIEQLNKCKAQVNTINGSNVLYIAGGYGYIRDQIWEERRMELCFEWERFFDLVRQRRAAEVIQLFGSNLANKRGYYFRKGVNEIFPIPQSEIDLSNGVLIQNPGY